MSRRTWILVADAARARILWVEPEGHALTLLDEREHPASRSKGSELLGDDRGRTRPRNRDAVRGSALSYTTPPKTVEAEAFARELADHLRLAHAHNEFNELVLIAPPQFLGTLRKVLDHGVAASVTASIDKDCTRETPDELLHRLRPKPSHHTAR